MQLTYKSSKPSVLDAVNMGDLNDNGKRARLGGLLNASAADKDVDLTVRLKVESSAVVDKSATANRYLQLKTGVLS